MDEETVPDYSNKRVAVLHQNPRLTEAAKSAYETRFPGLQVVAVTSAEELVAAIAQLPRNQVFDILVSNLGQSPRVHEERTEMFKTTCSRDKISKICIWTAEPKLVGKIIPKDSIAGRKVISVAGVIISDLFLTMEREFARAPAREQA